MNKFEFDIEAFRAKVEALCEKNIDFIDSILTICEKDGIELDTIVPILKKDPEFKSRLFIVAEKMNFIKKTTKLPKDFE